MNFPLWTPITNIHKVTAVPRARASSVIDVMPDSLEGLALFPFSRTLQ
jgi:hypothetical protein